MPDAPQVAGWPDNGLRFDYGTIYCYRTTDAGAYEVVLGDDSRLTDARTPLSHTHAQSDITDLVDDLAGKEAAGTASSVMQGHLDAEDPHPQYAGGGGADPLDTDLTYNEDGTLATLETTAGTKTFNYNEDGTLASITGTGDYVSKTFTYTDGVLTSVDVV